MAPHPRKRFCLGRQTEIQTFTTSCQKFIVIQTSFWIRDAFTYLNNPILSLGQECTATIVSSNTTKWCVFPFIYSGKTYEECTVDDSENSKPWCAYEVDEQRNVVRGKWADCNPECLEGGIRSKISNT